MINTDYNSMYGRLWNVGNFDQAKGKMTGKSKLSRDMANSFLNQMVFSHMGSSKEVFVPQISRGVLSAAFNAAYDYSDVEEKIRQSGDEDTTEETDVAESVETE